MGTVSSFLLLENITPISTVTIFVVSGHHLLIVVNHIKLDISVLIRMVKKLPVTRIDLPQCQSGLYMMSSVI